MKIDISNYEVFFLDYYEGRLDSMQQAGLMIFLEENPSLREKFDSFEQIFIEPDHSQVFDHRDSLKKQEIISCGPVDEHNYEEYFFDYHEGNLNELQKMQVRKFVRDNAFLEKDFSLMGLCYVHADNTISTGFADSLKKTVIIPSGRINASNYTEIFFASIENELDAAGTDDLEKFLSINPNLAVEFSMWSKTKLTSDTSITFPDKESLKKAKIVDFRRRRQLVYMAISSAASIAAIITVVFLFTDFSDPGSSYKGFSSYIMDSKNRIAPTAIIDDTLSQNHTADWNDAGSNQINSTDLIERRERIRLSATVIQEKEQTLPDLEHKTEYTDIFNYQKAIADTKYNPQSSSTEHMTIQEYGLTQIRKASGQTEPVDMPEKFSLWDLAAAGVAGYNVLANDDVALKRDTDENGKTIYFALGGLEFGKENR